MSVAQYDVVIVGGGLYGCSTAYHLLLREPQLQVAVLERDPTYEHAASVRSMAGVRILFSQAESIWMSQYGHEFYGDYPSLMGLGDEPGELMLQRHGYLLLGTTAGAARDIEANAELQRTEGCNIELHDAASLKVLRPCLHTDDVTLAVFSPDDVTADPYGALMGLRNKARSMGATLVTGAAAGVDIDAGQVRGVRLDDGQVLGAQWVVNALGAWAPAFCREVGFDVPVEPVPKMVCFFETQTRPEGELGVTIDGSRGGFRPLSAGYTTLVNLDSKQGQFHWEPDDALFETQKWPSLAHRVPAFEAIKLRSSYCCHYAQNVFDGNLLLGAWPGQPENFLIATGASGHGFQHAPAAGRGLAELIIDRQYSTLDLSRFGCQRVVDDKPDPERGFVA